jgi:hypothetical protein
MVYAAFAGLGFALVETVHLAGLPAGPPSGWPAPATPPSGGGWPPSGGGSRGR